MELLSVAAAQARVAELTAPPNHSVFEMSPFGRRAKPHCLYFCYMTDINNPVGGPPTYEMRIYYHDNCGSKLRKRDVRKITRKLVLNARRDFLTNSSNQPDPKGFCPPLCGRHFEDVKWRRKSYIVVVVDDPHWRLSRRGGGGGVDPVVVKDNGTTRNHNFFQAFEWRIEMPASAPTGHFDKYRTTAAAFRNHMVCNIAGADLHDDEEQMFTFDINVEDGHEFLPVPIDPDGTNLGPPLGPP